MFIPTFMQEGKFFKILENVLKASKTKQIMQ